MKPRSQDHLSSPSHLSKASFANMATTVPTQAPIALPIPSLSYPITHKAKIMGMPTFEATFTIICGYIKTESSIILKPLPPMSKRLIKKTIEITEVNKDTYLN